MKTSNIIILSTIAFVFLMNIWIIVDAKDKFEDVLKNGTSKEIKQETKAIPLDHFSHIIVSDALKLSIEDGEINTLSETKDEDIDYKVENDTLFISGEGLLTISCNELRSIKLKDDTKLISEDEFEGQYLLIQSLDDSKVVFNNVNINKLDIYAKNNSKVVMNNASIDTTNVLAEDNSKVNVSGELDVVRGEINNNSGLTVSGANNTQFSKSGNGRVNMY